MNVTFKNMAGLAFILALLSVGIYIYLNRPTPQEKVVVNFFSELKEGRYDEAEKYTRDGEFYRMAAATSVRDTNETNYLIGDYFPENRSELLRMAIESYLKPHIAKWKYLHLNTQVLDDNSSIVHFRVEFAIREFNGANILGQIAHDARMEGIANLHYVKDSWVIDAFEISIFSDEGLMLSGYLDQAN